MNSREFNYCLRELKNEEKAFKKLYVFYFPKIVFHIFYIYRNKDFGEDVAQEFFLKLLDIEDVGKVECPNAWVYTVAENIAKNIFNREKANLSDPLDEVQTSAFDTYTYQLYGEYWEKLNKLDDVTRKIIMMKVFEGYRFKEIADELNMKTDTARQKYCRGLKKLKKMSRN